ncbi:hypothetical protein AMR95_01725 [Bacillus sp. G1(2015b)]|nr:hypothetical protein AMR95_01725 [Bacillus sp. G1(2015b)]
MPKTIFNMAHALCRDNKRTEAKIYVKKGISLAQKNNDVEYYISKSNILQGLYVKEAKHLLDQCFAFFKSRQMYGDIEDFALEAAEYLSYCQFS